MRLRSFVFLAASLALGWGMFASTVRAEQCLVVCGQANSAGAPEVHTDPSRRCTEATKMRDCGAYCNAVCGALATGCNLLTNYQCIPALPQRPLATTGGTCAFQCANGQTPDARLNCATDADCQSDCDNVCATRAGVACAGSPAPHCVLRAAAATSTVPGSSARLSNPLGTSDLRVIGGRVARSLIGILGAVALLMFVVGGMLWMTAGDSKRVDQAKLILINSTIGIFLVFFAYFISVAVLAFFGA